MSAEKSVLTAEFGPLASDNTAPLRFRHRLTELTTRQPRPPKSLIGFLLAHGARARRVGRPRCSVLLEVVGPSGDTAVAISFGETEGGA